MRYLYTALIILILGCSFAACSSSPKAEEKAVSNPQIEDTVQETVISETDNIVTSDDEVEDVNDVVTLIDEEEEEYLRSTNNLSEEESVSKEEFTEDKNEILDIISELEEIMEDGDVDAWLSYIAPDSIKYYSNPVNIRKAQKKLPNKTIVLRGIGDYFKYVFIPARKRAQVKEIRYISKTNIKAVDVKDDGTVIVYYQFVKVNNKWLVHIPSL